MEQGAEISRLLYAALPSTSVDLSWTITVTKACYVEFSLTIKILLLNPPVLQDMCS